MVSDDTTRSEFNSQITDFLFGVIGVVEATSFEALTLWQENRSREHPMPWQESLSGYLKTIGYVGEAPVCLRLLTAEVNGHKLLFIHAASQIVDHGMIDDWLKAALPASARRPDGCVNRTDAMNFANVFPSRVEEAA